MYLARLRLDPRSAQVRRDLADPYEMHRTLVRAFLRDSEQKPSRILWRIEPEAAWSDPVVLVQSAQPGDWAALDGLPGYLKGAAETKHWVPENWIQAAERYRFRLFANPTVRRDGKRQGLISEDAQLNWLSRQGERAGFAVEVAIVTSSEILRGQKGAQHISLLRACFEGRLQVRDNIALAVAMRDGIGPGKAFGCGLLSLGRV